MVICLKNGFSHERIGLLHTHTISIVFNRREQCVIFFSCACLHCSRLHVVFFFKNLINRQNLRCYFIHGNMNLNLLTPMPSKYSVIIYHISQN